MPIYEYKCGICGIIHTKVRKMENREDPVKCECGGEAKNVMATPGRFQRSGRWRATMEAEMPGRV